MPRYYFDVREGNALAVDNDGLEFSNLDEVQTEASTTIVAMAKDVLAAFSMCGEDYRSAIEVRDDSGPVMRVSFGFAIETQLKGPRR